MQSGPFGLKLAPMKPILILMLLAASVTGGEPSKHGYTITFVICAVVVAVGVLAGEFERERRVAEVADRHREARRAGATHALGPDAELEALVGADHERRK